MTAAIARALMALAVCSLGDHRRQWALAMQAEFESAKEDRKSLTFAIGCLIAAYRELPAHEEGRFALASHLFALALLVPLAALMISSVLTGFPGSYLEHSALPDLRGIGEQAALLSEANRSAVPTLAILVLSLAAINLWMAWLALDRDWTRLSRAGFVGAAATATLVIFSAVVFVHPVVALAQVAVLAGELTGAWALAQWHIRLSAVASAPAIN